MFLESRVGRVTEYASDRGLGTVVSVEPDGRDGTTYAFHCTAIADGSREIADGAKVAFRVTAVGPGRWEAVDLQTVSVP